MPERDDQGQGLRETRVVDEGAAIPSQASRADMDARINDSDRTWRDQAHDSGGGELRIEEQPTSEGTLPPPSAHRADTMVRAVSPAARQEMERGNDRTNQPSFTKGDNAPTADRSRYPYTVEDMDELLTEAPKGLFPDTPGGDGATPLSPDRGTFLATMGDRGHFPSQQETEKWARAVFNAIRQCAIEHDEALATEFASVVRIGEAPEVQVEEMMWGGDFLGRMRNALNVDSKWSVQDFYAHVAGEAGQHVDDPKVEAAIVSFFGTLKSYLTGDGMTNLNELQEVWNRV